MRGSLDESIGQPGEKDRQGEDHYPPRLARFPDGRSEKTPEDEKQCCYCNARQKINSAVPSIGGIARNPGNTLPSDNIKNGKPLLAPR